MPKAVGDLDVEVLRSNVKSSGIFVQRITHYHLTLFFCGVAAVKKTRENRFTGEAIRAKTTSRYPIGPLHRRTTTSSTSLARLTMGDGGRTKDAT